MTSRKQKGYPPIKTVRKTGVEHFHQNGLPIDQNLMDFWSWSTSDLVNNSTRGVLAEFLVASALKLSAGIREPWNAYDLVTSSGKKIEVKSAAYIQSWYHRELSKIVFGIRPTRSWDAATNKQAKEQKRQADIYVYCVLCHQDKDTIDPMNVSQWEFYVLSASTLNQKLPKQKSITLAKLSKLKPLKVTYSELARAIEDISS